MPCDQLNTLVITKVINIATSQGSSQRLHSDIWNYFDKVESKRVPAKSVSRILHIMATLQTCATTYKGPMAPCMFLNVLILSNKKIESV